MERPTQRVSDALLNTCQSLLSLLSLPTLKTVGDVSLLAASPSSSHCRDSPSCQPSCLRCPALPAATVPTAQLQLSRNYLLPM